MSFQEWYETLPSFMSWGEEFINWKKRDVDHILSAPLPNEAQGIVNEHHNLPALYSKAGRHASLAEHYYYKAVTTRWAELIKEGYPKSAVRQMAKDKSFQEILFREEATRLREDLRQRAFKVEYEYKRLEDSINVRTH